MDQPPGHEIWVMPLAAVIVLAVLWWRGLLGLHSLRSAPPRHVGFGGMDLLFGTLIFLGSMALAPTLLGLVGLASPDVPANAFVVRTLLAQLIIQLPLVVYVVWRAAQYAGGLRQFGLLPRRPWREAAIAVVALPVAVALVFGLNVAVLEIGRWAGHERPEVGHQLLRVAQLLESPAALATLAFSAVVVAAVLEEIIFRGWLQTCLLDLFGRAWRWSAVIMASIAFTVMHLGMPWQVLPGLFVLSMILGWLYERTGSLLPCILLHAGFNALNLGVTLAAP
jgi:uncharacterized protein